MEPILIASSQFDDANYIPVVAALKKRGFKTLVYKADSVARGSEKLTIRINSADGLQVYYDDRLVDFTKFKAAWYRRPSFFGENAQDKESQSSINKERIALQSGLWASVSLDAWLNSPQNILHADNKILQLAYARENGFDIPDTIISNHWDAIQKDLPEKIVYKTVYGTYRDKENDKFLYATPVVNSASSLPTHTSPYPGIWQTFLHNKKREWRITIVGDRVFAAAIYTDKSSKHDWRRYQHRPDKVQFKAEAFSEKLKDKCREYLHHFNLRFGCFDFVETDGGIYFLECNPNGQYGWLEELLGLPISEAIANELADIATQ